MANLILLIAIPLTVAGVFLLRRRSGRIRELHLGAVLIVLILLILISVSLLGSMAAFYWTRSRLDALDTDGTKVLISGADRERRILTELRGMRRSAAHHSSPTAQARVVITGEAGSLDLLLRRDSDWGTEVWVFAPWYSESVEVGRVQSQELTDLLWPDEH